MQTLTFLGRDSGFGENNTSAYIEDGENLTIIDCGITVFKLIKEKFNLTKYNNIYVIITHLHNDHAGSLSHLILYAWFNYNKKIKVVSKCNQIKDYLNITGVPTETYEIKEKLENLGFIKTEHTDFLDAYGFKMILNNRKIVYTGDTNTLKPFLPHLIDADEFYVDVSKYGGAHLKIEDIIETLKHFKKNGTDIFLMHLDDREYIKNITQNQFFTE